MHTKTFISTLSACLLALMVMPAASASDRYLDSLFLSPGPMSGADAAAFEAVLQSIDRREYPQAEMRIGAVIDSFEAQTTASAEAEKNNAADDNDAEINERTLARLLANRGIIKALNAGMAEGLLDIDLAISRLEAVAGNFDLSLIKMLVAKALISEDNQAFEVAEESLRRAQHIAHRQDGVYTQRQLPIIRHLTGVHLAQGLVLYADREQRFNLKISEQAYGEDSELLLPVLEQVGTYFANRGDTLPAIAPSQSKAMQSQAEAFTDQYRTALFRESVDLFNRAIEIVEDNYGPNDLRLVPPLKGLANVRLLQRTSAKFAESAMERALAIVASNPSSDVTDHARALVDLGDIYTITADSRADDTYLEAWNLLSEDPDLFEVRNALFGTPTRLFPEKIRIIALDRQPMEVREGDPLFANVEYSVEDNGRVARVKVVDGNVPNEEKNLLRRHLRSARFRPRIVEGEIVETPGLMLHQTFEVFRPEPQFSTSFQTNP